MFRAKAFFEGRQSPRDRAGSREESISRGVVISGLVHPISIMGFWGEADDVWCGKEKLLDTAVASCPQSNDTWPYYRICGMFYALFVSVSKFCLVDDVSVKVTVFIR
ncbi:hypothetical protein AVEN_265968-1 [Araneus ventricosus]|uniref:Uncharacterized protein n=1 Tax=Araneus ventricosus TaxID=182803 RepID=A0A4Y2GJU6_ARAVE|nr:hypothetical protein AVEN_265968-1 [Araneus ventricosus]